MGWLLPAMTQDKLDGQRDVVKNERRQSYENRPYGLAFETILAALYPPEHPYHWPVIGSMADLDAATLEDVHDFFRTYYAPNNASLVVAGGVDGARVLPLVERYFGEIPRGPEAPEVKAAPVVVNGGRRLVLEDDVRLPRLYLAWHSPAFFAEGDAALDAAATILAEGKASRLHRALVYERGVAQDVQAFQDSRKLGSIFFIVVTARPDVALDELERETMRQLEAIAAGDVAPGEVERARNRIETAFIDELQHVLGRADRLNLYAYYTGAPGYANADLERYLRLDAGDIAGAVRRFLVEAPPVALSVVPRGRLDLASGAP